MRRRHQPGKKGNHERWLLTYSDLITLLMIFFVVMYALSSLNAKKFQAVALSLSRAMGGGGQSVMNEPGASFVPGVTGSSLVKEVEMTLETEENSNLERIRKELQAYIDENGLNGKVTVSIEERGVVLSFQDVALFPLGSAQLTPDAKSLVGSIGQILKKAPHYLRVEGHTDNLPINTSQYPSNWELSVARATSVVQELVNVQKLSPELLSAAGYGEFRPKVPNETAESRQQNRRVDIVVLKSKYETAEPMAQSYPLGRPNLEAAGN
ncbi:flagellar motor protein MotB [Pelotomaculum propionicicum]|uniref:Motility protein B n=1 Tax=Pelotomaculum propionicicum TaxID=258475 RepID=A0A4Y7RQ80_9FIRM|nr:flagellar motor protein MotB [Pelotomaculum propionicicum]NLI13192.1 OmpA family protein [Peptococcaceae bacterium]TEB11178.1 Motility protein B [Pelotomaculum propionicicum]